MDLEILFIIISLNIKMNNYVLEEVNKNRTGYDKNDKTNIKIKL